MNFLKESAKHKKNTALPKATVCFRWVKGALAPCRKDGLCSAAKLG